jgi:hypothetical protein
MRRIRVDATTVDQRTNTVDVKVEGPATYYLRFYVDGTFDVFAKVAGELVAIGGVGTDGVVSGSSLVARLDRFIRECAPFSKSKSKSEG